MTNIDYFLPETKVSLSKVDTLPPINLEDLFSTEYLRVIVEDKKQNPVPNKDFLVALDKRIQFLLDKRKGVRQF